MNNFQDKVGFIADIKNKVIRYLSIEPSDVRVIVLGTGVWIAGTFNRSAAGAGIRP